MSGRTRILIWLVFLAVCVVGVTRARFTADLSAFLPSSPTEEQQLLVGLLRDGMVSRLILIGIEGGKSDARTRASAALADILRRDRAFAAIDNGASVNRVADEAWLFRNRFLLSPAVTPARFSPAGLHAAIGHTLDLLASSEGLLIKPLLVHDPTAETFNVAESLGNPASPPRRNGVWVSRDGKRALLLATTTASGSDTDGQEAAIDTIRTAFAKLATRPGLDRLKLVMTGPSVFAVNARATIKDEAMRLSLIGAGLIVTLLLVVYRSLTTLLLSLAPVATGALAGVLAVSLVFGTVQGVTLVFGITLIGEAVDYAIYFFIQDDDEGRQSFWHTIRLGVLTSLFGFAALLVTGFPGLSQLGLYSMAGLTAAVLTTRFVLPALTPANFQVRDVTRLGLRLTAWLQRTRPLRRIPALLAVLAAGVLLVRQDNLWSHQLGALSPVSDASQALDASLRSDLAAPDVRYLAVVGGRDADAALAGAERISARLDRLQAQGVIGGYDSAARFLPSRATQLARRNSLPDGPTLRAALAAATRNLPLHADRLAPFIRDVEAARRAPLVTRAGMAGTSFAQAVDTMLIHRGDRWYALLPLRSPARGPSAGVIDPRPLRSALADSGVPDVVFVDLKAESERLYAGYLRGARTAAIGGIAAIIVLLLAALRSPRRVLRLALPLAAAVLVVVATLALTGERLTLLHLIGMLLVVAVGSNYVLFFDAADAQGSPLAPRALASLVIANLATLAGFGILALSTVPVLHDIGIVVGPGTWLALLFSALLFGGREPTAIAARD